MHTTIYVIGYKSSFCVTTRTYYQSRHCAKGKHNASANMFGFDCKLNRNCNFLSLFMLSGVSNVIISVAGLSWQVLCLPDWFCEPKF